jgi:predicted nucleic acid-binding protein
VILVDSSVWIDHLRAGSSELESLLNDLRVLVHPFVIGELACGNLRNRKEVLDLIGDLPQVSTAVDQEVLYFIEQHELMGKGIGYIDAHLLASVALTPPAVLWTRDIRLESLAIELKLCFSG